MEGCIGAAQQGMDAIHARRREGARSVSRRSGCRPEVTDDGPDLAALILSSVPSTGAALRSPSGSHLQALLRCWRWRSSLPPMSCCGGWRTRRSMGSTRSSAWQWRLQSPRPSRPASSQRVNLTIDLLQNRVSDRALAWLKVGGGVSLLVFYVLLAWRIGAYALQLQERGAETIFVQLPMAPFVWAIAAFVAVSALVQVIALFVSVSYALAGIHHAREWSIGAAGDQLAGYRTGRQSR